MFTKEDRKTFGVLAELATKRYDEDNAWLTKKCDELYDRALKANTENMKLRTKVDIYKKLISKLLDYDSKPSDEIFMIDGKIYKPISHTITATKGQYNTATVEFNCVSDISSLLKKDE